MCRWFSSFNNACQNYTRNYEYTLALIELDNAFSTTSCRPLNEPKVASLSKFTGKLDPCCGGVGNDQHVTKNDKNP